MLLAQNDHGREFCHSGSGECLHFSYSEVFRFLFKKCGSRPSVVFFSFNPDGNVCMGGRNGRSYCATTGRDAAALTLRNAVQLEMANDGHLFLLYKMSQ